MRISDWSSDVCSSDLCPSQGSAMSPQSPADQAPAVRTVEWRVESAPVDYPQALAEMEARTAAIFEGRAAERVWLLEHPPLYTAGTSADPEIGRATCRARVCQYG